MRRFLPPKPKPQDKPYFVWTIAPECPMDIADLVAAAVEHLRRTSGYPPGSTWLGPHTAEGYWKERHEADDFYTKKEKQRT